MHPPLCHQKGFSKAQDWLCVSSSESFSMAPRSSEDKAWDPQSDIYFDEILLKYPPDMGYVLWIKV